MEAEYLRAIIQQAPMLVQVVWARDWDMFRMCLMDIQEKAGPGTELDEVRYILFNGDDGGILGRDLEADPTLLEKMERILKEVDGKWDGFRVERFLDSLGHKA